MLGLLILLTACSGPGIAGPKASSSSLRVVVRTAGAERDADGYQFQLDDRAPIGLSADGELSFSDLSPGIHRVGLEGIASNCSAANNPRTVDLAAGGGLEVRFDVVCGSTVGVLEVTVTTTGLGADPAGYTLTLDAGPMKQVGLSETVTFPDLTPGLHTVLLAGVTPACTTGAVGSIGVAVVAGSTVVDSITVRCTGNLSGRLLVDDAVGISAIDPNGTNPTELTGGLVAFGGRWSPDGETIVFVGREAGDQDLYVMNRDGTHPTRLTHTTVAEEAPVWSPDGSQIAFSYAGPAGSGSIVVMNRDGSNQRTLSAGSNPAWSPNGERIAFVRAPGSSCPSGLCPIELHVVNVDGSNDIRLVRGAAQPAWSPDGKRIAFRRNQSLLVGPAGLFILAVAESHLTSVPGSRFGSAPVWSPDGAALAFAAGSEFELNIAMLGSPVVSLPTGLKHVRPTSWR